MNEVLEAIYNFRCANWPRGIEPKRIYLGRENKRRLYSEAEPWRFGHSMAEPEFMGLRLFFVIEEEHIHVC